MISLIAAFSIAASSPSQSYALVHARGEPTLSIFHEPGRGPSVLYVHGSTFPTASSIAYRLKGKSWADDLHERGFDVWSLDFPGFGKSGPAVGSHGEIPGRAFQAVHQIERAACYIRERTGRSNLSIIAHSWGTIAAGMFAARHPEIVRSLVLFGPVAERKSGRVGPTSAFKFVSSDDQWESFQAGVPKDHPSPMSSSDFAPWAKSYLAADPAAERRNPPSVRVPTGPDADLADAWSGRFPYRPSGIRAPTLIVRGEWDPIAKDADANWLVAALGGVSGGARDVKLPGGAHRMHLEENRQALFDAVGTFLEGASK